MLLVYQPKLYNYRSELFDAIANSYPILVIDGTARFFFFICNTISIFSIHIELKFIFHLLFDRRISHVFMPHDLKSFSCYFAPLICLLRRRKYFLHGQGDFKYKLKNPIYKLFFLLTTFFVYRYISYANLCAKPSFFSRINEPTVVFNRFESVDSHKVISDSPLNLLYIGRMRSQSGVKSLLTASRQLTNDGYPHLLHLVGVSPSQVTTTNYQLPYGDIRDESLISHIAQDCSLGVYFGNCGLSALHYMRLGLCPIVHSDLSSHSGPEPSYIKHMLNGAFFNRDSIQSFITLVKYLLDTPGLILPLRKNAYHTALEIHKVPYSEELLSSLGIT